MHCCSEDMNSALTIFLGFVLFLVITLISRAAWLLFSRKYEACEKRDGPIKTLVVVGSGKQDKSAICSSEEALEHACAKNQQATV